MTKQYPKPDTCNKSTPQFTCYISDIHCFKNSGMILVNNGMNSDNQQKKEVMKTIFSTTALFLLINTIAITATAGIFPGLPGELKNRTIARDTAGITTPLLYQPSLTKEDYVDDIPFDTHEVSTGYLVAMLTEQNQEDYIDDIPFNTALIAGSQPSYMASRFANEAEPYINDIPFNTSIIAEKYFQSRNCRVVCVNLNH